MAEFAPPMTYHGVFCFGVTYYVDDDVRKEIEHWIKLDDDDSRRRTLDITTTFGEEVTLTEGHVGSIFSTTPDTRARDRAMMRMWKVEEKADQPVEDM